MVIMVYFILRILYYTHKKMFPNYINLVEALVVKYFGRQ